MKELPKAMIVVDPKEEEIAIREARKLGITTFGIVDTNCDPEVLDYPIPGNDDAVRAVKVVLNALTNAIATVNGNEIVDVITEEEKDKKEEPKKNSPKKPYVKEEKEVKVEKETKEETSEEIKEDTKDVKELTLTELKDLAKSKGIKGYSKMKKDELLEVLK